MSTAAEQVLARRFVGLLDLTSLEDRDTPEKIAALCARAITPAGPVAAVCVYGRFVAQCREALADSGVKVATVVNFPHGSPDIAAAVAETRSYVAAGADEIDTVLPYERFIAGDRDVARGSVAAVREAAGGATLKVILETGAIDDADLIAEASALAIAAGADFIKTSTGKKPVGATVAAARIMLTAIKASGRPVGFKAAGGVRTLEQAAEYVALAESVMGAGWVTPQSFRIGASGLLDDLLRRLDGSAARSPGSPY